jgi:arylsulfatase A
MTTDGRSFWPQLQGQAGTPREWSYSWYAPQGEFKWEFARDLNFKLYRDGRFFDLKKDPEEKSTIDTVTLAGENAKAHSKLAAALKKFDNARPKRLATGNAPAEEKPKQKKKNK